MINAKLVEDLRLLTQRNLQLILHIQVIEKRSKYLNLDRFFCVANPTGWSALTASNMAAL